MSAEPAAGEFLDEFDPEELEEHRFDYDLGATVRCIQRLVMRGRDRELRRQSLRTVTTIEDVEAGFDHACDLLLDHWEENVRRWKARG